MHFSTIDTIALHFSFETGSLTELPVTASVWSIILLIHTLLSIIFGMNADTLTASVLENWKFPILFSSLASTVAVTVFIWVGK